MRWQKKQHSHIHILNSSASAHRTMAVAVRRPINVLGRLTKSRCTSCIRSQRRWLRNPFPRAARQGHPCLVLPLGLLTAPTPTGLCPAILLRRDPTSCFMSLANRSRDTHDHWLTNLAVMLFANLHVASIATAKGRELGRQLSRSRIKHLSGSRTSTSFAVSRQAGIGLRPRAESSGCSVELYMLHTDRRREMGAQEAPFKGKSKRREKDELEVTWRSQGLCSPRQTGAVARTLPRRIATPQRLGPAMPGPGLRHCFTACPMSTCIMNYQGEWRLSRGYRWTRRGDLPSESPSKKRPETWAGEAEKAITRCTWKEGFKREEISPPAT